MVMSNILTKRFDELAKQREDLEDSCSDGMEVAAGESVDHNALLKWHTKAANLLQKACGEKSAHYVNFMQLIQVRYDTNKTKMSRLNAVFEAAHEDFAGGYLTSVRTLIASELFSSELEQATELLSKRYKVAAAVIAGTVLETGIRELCDRNGVGHGKLDKMNADLTKAGVYTLLVQKRITALAEIRNKAAHGHPDQFNEDDVKTMITDVERFLAEHLA
jgi:hypothetical protein